MNAVLSFVQFLFVMPGLFTVSVYFMYSRLSLCTVSEYFYETESSYRDSYALMMNCVIIERITQISSSALHAEFGRSQST